MAKRLVKRPPAPEATVLEIKTVDRYERCVTCCGAPTGCKACGGTGLVLMERHVERLERERP